MWVSKAIDQGIFHEVFGSLNVAKENRSAAVNTFLAENRLNEMSILKDSIAHAKAHVTALRGGGNAQNQTESDVEDASSYATYTTASDNEEVVSEGSLGLLDLITLDNADASDAEGDVNYVVSPHLESDDEESGWTRLTPHVIDELTDAL